MTSTRLPGKILMLAKHKPMLAYHIERLHESEIPIYLATTTNLADDPVVAFAGAHHITYSRGSEDNVLSRYYECAVENELDIIIRVTSDCPLIDGTLIRKGVEEYLEMNDPDLYVSNTLERTFPRGFDFEIFSFQLLEEAYQNAILDFDKEHVTPYIHQNRSGHVRLHNIANQKNAGRFRITLDTIEDFELLKQLIENYGADQLNYNQIIEILDTHPELVQINEHVEQKKV
jgi:spore coat polysaccharide biosynthesis protein SpsF